MLYLGELAPNQVESEHHKKYLKLDSATMQALANNRDIFWQDKRAYLNQAFKEAKEQAAWLKIISLLSLDYFYGKYLNPNKYSNLIHSVYLNLRNDRYFRLDRPAYWFIFNVWIITGFGHWY